MSGHGQCYSYRNGKLNYEYRAIRAKSASVHQGRQIRARKDHKRRRHPIAFVMLVIFGFLFHTGAFLLTVVAITTNQGSELNPLFYLFGPWNFAAFGYAVLVMLYATLWFMPIPPAVRWSMVILLTIVTGFDFYHDLMVMVFH